MIKYDFSLLAAPPAGEGEGDEWLNARRGRITASKRAHMILHSRKATLNSMMDEMGEELQHPAGDGFSSAATNHGHAFENQAIGEYQMMRLTGGKIDRNPGMLVHPDFDIASATPDFFEGADITGQIKCPYKLKNHLNLLHFGVKMVNSSYYTQVQFESFVSQRPNIAFVSYHPEAPATNQVYIELMCRDESMHAKFVEKLVEIEHMLVNHERYEVKKPVAGVDGIPDIF